MISVRDYRLDRRYLGMVFGRHLLIVSTYFPPNERAGGAEFYANMMAQCLARDHGWRVSVIAVAADKNMTKEVTSDGIVIYRLPYRFHLSNSPISAAWLQRLRILIAEIEPDLINIHLPVPGLGDVVSYFSGHRPIVLNYHFGTMRKGRFAPDLLISVYEKIILPVALKKAARIICPSGYVRNDFLHDFAAKTSIISPAVDIERFYPALNRVTQPNILYVGSLDRSYQHKRLSDLLEACRLLCKDIPSLRLNIVGSGDGRADYEKLISAMGIADSVEFSGRLEGSALAEAYRHAGVFALPSQSEAFGMVVTEAMATALPVVSVNSGGVPELVENGCEGILVPPRDPESLADALRIFLTDNEKATRCGLAGRQKVCEQFSWSRQISLVNDVLLEAIPNRQGRSR